MTEPRHPGEILMKYYMGPARLNVTEAAKALDIGRVQLSRIVNCQASISIKMAISLALTFEGTSAEGWLILQMKYDLYKYRHHRSVRQDV